KEYAVVTDLSLAHESAMRNSYLLPTHSHVEAFATAIAKQAVEEAFCNGILYSSHKYEALRDGMFTGGDVADFLFMESREVESADIENFMHELIALGENDECCAVN
ncbi:MAG: hypothetical protein Q8Q57_00235, partial [Methylotenera sp.]|nr:hypothetical protein [Methylotenera sp.]